MAFSHVRLHEYFRIYFVRDCRIILDDFNIYAAFVIIDWYAGMNDAIFFIWKNYWKLIFSRFRSHPHTTHFSVPWPFHFKASLISTLIYNFCVITITVNINDQKRFTKILRSIEFIFLPRYWFLGLNLALRLSIATQKCLPGFCWWSQYIFDRYWRQGFDAERARWWYGRARHRREIAEYLVEWALMRK